MPTTQQQRQCRFTARNAGSTSKDVARRVLIFMNARRKICRGKDSRPYADAIAKTLRAMRAYMLIAAAPNGEMLMFAVPLKCRRAITRCEKISSPMLSYIVRRGAA